jgi:leucyl-tRNA synthetase
MPSEDSQLIQEIVAFLQALLSSSQPTNDNTPARRKRQTSTSCPTLLQSIKDSRLVIKQYQSELTATIDTIDLLNDQITNVTSNLIATTNLEIVNAYMILLKSLKNVSNIYTTSMNTIQNSMLNIVQNLNTLQAQYNSNNCDVSALMTTTRPTRVTGPQNTVPQTTAPQTKTTTPALDCLNSEKIRVVETSKCVENGGMFVLETCSCAL